MRAITMTVAEANATLDGRNQWITRLRGSDILPPSINELVAIHESVDYPDFVDPLVKTSAPTVFSGQIVAVAKAGQWKYTGGGKKVKHVPVVRIDVYRSVRCGYRCLVFCG
jgi:hypothetical protein